MNNYVKHVCKTLISGIAMLSMGWSAAIFGADTEHLACHNVDYAYQQHTPKQLRAIAATCGSEALTRLYYNRAYHLELLQEGATLSQIIASFSSDVSHHIEAYRMYIALIEAFAPAWYADADARVAFLNREYDHRGEVTELRLHGYDHLADVKEKQNSYP